MKSMLFVFSLLLASCLAITEPTDDELAFKVQFEDAMARFGITPYMLESNIISKINNTLDGLPEWIDFYNINITTPNDTLVAHGSLQNCTITGMKNHIVDDVKFAILPLGFHMHLNLPDVLVNGIYDIDAELLRLIPVYGSGIFSAGATNVDVVVGVAMASNGGFLSVSKLDFTFSVDKVTFDLKNFLNGMGDVIGELLNDWAAEYIDRIMYYYGDVFRGVIQSKVNVFLSDKTVDDLLNWIKQTTTEAPTTVPTFRRY